MNVANIDLCKELFELTGWDETESHFSNLPSRRLIQSEPGDAHPTYIPANDLAYLLRRLPDWASIIKEGRYADGAYKYCAQIVNEKPLLFASNPEDAAGRL